MENDINTDLFVLQSHLEGMLDRVKLNSTTLHRFQAFEMRLLNLNSLAEMIDHILDDARHYFDLDVISLCLIDEKGEIAKYLNDDGYECHSKKGLILLDNKNLLLSIFGLTIHPYIGVYKNAKCDEFFSGFAEKPASVAITPLNRRGKYLGTLNLGSYQTDRFSDTMATDFVDHLVSVVSICLENNLNFETMRRTSFVDSLTGVNNRRFLEQRIVEELDRCRRNADPISCLFLDIDYFKVVNDKLGHHAGDRVLCAVASAIKTQLRSNDVLARYGGEEFVALLSNINEVMALEIAERIRKTIQSLHIKLDEDSISVTISIGSSTYLPESSAFPGESDISTRLIKLADSALYVAKRNGRNRVENGGVVSEKPLFGKVAAS
ncbi:MAG: sensor domain-containing diguanylate cyclase [Methylococcaceae bacterium]|nr:sensor domain-containing diguanylate cyclase [Methylococcaceae bacterium]